jgi:hypothetical protein
VLASKLKALKGDLKKGNEAIFDNVRKQKKMIKQMVFENLISLKRENIDRGGKGEK